MTPLFNLFFIQVGDYDNLVENYEAFKNQQGTAKLLGTLFANDRLGDLVLAEYVNRKDTNSDVYTTFFGW